MKYDAFISYRRKTSFAMARLIRDQLIERALHCFLDLKEDCAGEFDERIPNAVRSSSNFILILSKDALNGCVNEDDWMRREILAAFEGGCTIIPILCPDFTWPEELNPLLPPEVRRIETLQGVFPSPEYFDSAIDKLVSYMTGVKPINPKTEKKVSLYVESSRFILEKLGSVEDFVSVDMAFHAGSEWHRNTDMVDTLSRLYQMGCRLRVIINSPEAVEEVCRHMRQPMKKYVKFENNVSDWLDFAREYPDYIQVRVLDVPLLHRLYIVRGEHGGSANVKYYSYGNYTPEKDFRLTFDSPDPEYALYAGEFEYLWSIAKEIE